MSANDAPTNGTPARPTSVRRERLEHVAWLLDSSIRLPILGYRIGLDPLIGLIPGIGDAVGALLSGYILVEAIRLKASRVVLLKMVINVVVEVIVGALPLVGDVFDAAWKANERNMQLLEDYLDDPERTRRRSRATALMLLAGLAVVVVAVIVLGVLVLEALWTALA